MKRNMMCYDAFIFKIYCYESVFHRMKIFFFFFPFEITKKIFYIIKNKILKVYYRSYVFYSNL